jgi:hypothetical protein
MASVHETAEGLMAADVMNRQTMREFGQLVFPAIELPSKSYRLKWLSGV